MNSKNVFLYSVFFLYFSCYLYQLPLYTCLKQLKTLKKEPFYLTNTLLSVYSYIHIFFFEGPNPNIYSKFGILKSRDEWRQNPPGGVTPAQRGIVEADFAVAMSLYHGYDLLTQHGMRPFFNFFTKKENMTLQLKKPTFLFNLMEQSLWG